MTSTAEFSVIPAANISGPVTISQANISLEQAKRLIDDWVAKQDKFWPQELTGEVLSRDVRVFHAAHWILSGAASGNWSASIGVDREDRITCPKCVGRGTYKGKNVFDEWTDFTCYQCGGKGYNPRTITDWHSQSGVARGVVDQRIIENVAADTEIRCGKRDRSASEYQLSQRDDVLVFTPERIDHETGLTLARNATLSALEYDANSAASGLGRVRDLRLGYVNYERLEARTWLYPIYASKYEYEGSSHLVEIDGITGKTHVQVPQSVRSQRTIYGLKIASAVIVPILLVFLVIYLANQRPYQPPYVAPAPIQNPAVAATTTSPNREATAAAGATAAARATVVRATSRARVTATANARVTATAKAGGGQQATPAAQAIAGQSLTGRVTGDGLRVRPGPGTEYDPPITRLRSGTVVSIVGWSNASDGTRWWKIASPAGWVSSEFIDERGCIECVPQVEPPSRPSQARVQPTPVPSTRQALASNRGSLIGQGQDGWSPQFEQGRSSGNFVSFSDRRSYDGADCYASPLEDYVRLCADGELHPGQQSRVAYRWDSNYDGPATISVHGHKIDTRCGDGIWVGTFAGGTGQEPRKLGEFSIAGSDNRGRTVEYDVQLSTASYILVMVDIGGNAQCDQSRVYVDVFRK